MKGFYLPLGVVSMLYSCMTEVSPFNVPRWKFATSPVPRLVSEQFSPWMSNCVVSCTVVSAIHG